MVLPEGIELSTSPLPRECSTTELRQPGGAFWRLRKSKRAEKDDARQCFPLRAGRTLPQGLTAGKAESQIGSAGGENVDLW